MLPPWASTMALAMRQPQARGIITCALASGVGPVEAVKDKGQVFGSNARTGVAYF